MERFFVSSRLVLSTLTSSINFFSFKKKKIQAQNELLVRKHLKPGDAYVHADVHGAASVIVKNHRKVSSAGAHAGGAGAHAGGAAAASSSSSSSSAPAPAPSSRSSSLRPPLPALSLAQAGACAVCRSSAWSSKVVARAWWVEAGQVSKQPPTGEFLTQVRGDEIFLVFLNFFLGGGLEVVGKKKKKKKKAHIFHLLFFLFLSSSTPLPPPTNQTKKNKNREPS